MRVKVILKPIKDEDSTGIAIEYEALAKAMLKDPTCLMSVEAMLLGVFSEVIRMLRQRKDFVQNKHMIDDERESRKRPGRDESECLGCRFDIVNDKRAAKIVENVLVRCGMCGKFCQPIYDADGVLISPSSESESAA